MNKIASNSNKDVDSVSELPMTPQKGFLFLIAVVVVISGFIAINLALGFTEFWVAFLFMLYWTGVDEMDFERLPSCIVGAGIGLLLGYLMKMLPVFMGDIGGLVFLGLIFLLIYCKIMNWVPIAVNTMTMLFLTVTTIPALQESVSFPQILAALLVGILYFIGLIFILKKIFKK